MEAMARASQSGAAAGLSGLGSFPREPLRDIQYTTRWNGGPRTTHTAPDLRVWNNQSLGPADARGRPQSALGVASHNVPLLLQGLSGCQNHGSVTGYQEIDA